MNKLKSIFKNMKATNSSGYHGISMKLIKNQKNSLLPLILNMINQIIHTKIFPQILKIQKVIPICKNNIFLDPSSYRGINLLSPL